MKRLYVTSFPRTRGDEPWTPARYVAPQVFSPHTRG